MLVLSRKVDESIDIDGRIKVMVKKISGNRVTLGIDAPADVTILRSELREHVEPGLEHRVEYHTDWSHCHQSDKEETNFLAAAI